VEQCIVLRSQKKEELINIDIKRKI